MSYDKLVAALRCKGLSKKCDSCGYGYHISPDSECNDACHFEQIAEDAAAAIEELQQIADHHEQTAKDYWKEACEYKAQLSKRGEWIYHPKDAIEMMFTLPKCSICGHESSDALNYCPNCGAKMEVQE